jgi:hypothetical protein
MSLRHVQRGQPLRIPADDWNRIIDATRAHYEQMGRPAPVAARGRHHPGAGLPGVWVRNDTGSDLPLFGVAGLGSPLITPDQHLAEWQHNPSFSVTAVDAGLHGKGLFVVVLEPLATGAIGRAILHGVTPVRVDVTDEEHGFATVAEGQAALMSAVEGPAQILWRAGGTGEQWALVRLGIQPFVSPVRFGLVVDDWERNQTVVQVHPCQPDGSNADTEVTLELWLGSMHGSSDVDGFGGIVPDLRAGQVVQYLERDDGAYAGIAIDYKRSIDPDPHWFDFTPAPEGALTHVGPWVDDPASRAFDVVVDVEQESWECGRVRVYRAVMQWDSRGHTFDPAGFDTSDDWADVYV